MNQNPKFQTMIIELTKAMAKSRQDRIKNMKNYTQEYLLNSDNDIDPKIAQYETYKIQSQKHNQATQSNIKVREEIEEETVSPKT